MMYIIVFGISCVDIYIDLRTAQVHDLLLSSIWSIEHYWISTFSNLSTKFMLRVISKMPIYQASSFLINVILSFRNFVILWFFCQLNQTSLENNCGRLNKGVKSLYVSFLWKFIVWKFIEHLDVQIWCDLYIGILI